MSEYNCTYDEAIAACKNAIDDLGFTLESEDNGLIKASTPASLLSFGETITINVESNGSKSQIEIDSSSFQLTTWGKNSTNINNLHEQIEKNLQ